MIQVVERKLTIPYNYTPRPYQEKFWEAMQAGCKRAILVWHRRAGKDKTTLNHTIAQMVRRQGVYYYFFPTFQQGRRILWDGIDRDGPILGHFPPEIVTYKNETEMKIGISNGSLFQIVGTDQFDSIRGTNPIGCVFSEFSEQNPGAWEVVRPILKENGGWAVFCSTPKGKNHLWRLYKAASANREWFTELLTVENTKAYTRKEIQAEIDLGMDPDFAEQEFYCSFTGAISGSYFGRMLDLVEKDNRITRVPWEPLLPVHTAWDLGMDDAMAIWFWQNYKREKRFIEYLDGSGEGLPWYMKLLRERPYVYGRHKAPFDINVRELGTGKTRLETARGLGLHFDVVPKLSPDDQIQAARSLFPLCWFDEVKTLKGLDGLRSYRKEYDEKLQTFRRTPLHDWSSHPADAFKVAAVGMRESDDTKRALVSRNAEINFDPLTHGKTPGFTRERTKDALVDFDPYR